MNGLAPLEMMLHFPWRTWSSCLTIQIVVAPWKLSRREMLSLRMQGAYAAFLLEDPPTSSQSSLGLLSAHEPLGTLLKEGCHSSKLLTPSPVPLVAMVSRTRGCSGVKLDVSSDGHFGLCTRAFWTLHSGFPEWRNELSILRLPTNPGGKLTLARSRDLHSKQQKSLAVLLVSCLIKTYSLRVGRKGGDNLYLWSVQRHLSGRKHRAC